ncbi:ExbD/TolR family protein [Oceaniglobus ichthyenteri]|uniref:ExbD/TolR family protein n=1 Tax=Oceaniglobus ichthyenteri TaxID=2136177 RepID=UPI000D3A3B2A|nr:biopolymer transporter ExbD [Oceaniglobus ichthyenteri]
MRFNRPTRRPVTESAVPMINVVFLLLIFFLMSARIAPPPPFDLTLPVSSNDATIEEAATLYISANGIAGFQGRQGDGAWIALSAIDRETHLTLRADAALPAPRMAAILARLAGMGFDSFDLAVRRP